MPKKCIIYLHIFTFAHLHINNMPGAYCYASYFFKMQQAL